MSNAATKNNQTAAPVVQGVVMRELFSYVDWHAKNYHAPVPHDDLVAWGVYKKFGDSEHVTKAISKMVRNKTIKLHRCTIVSDGYVPA